MRKKNKEFVPVYRMDCDEYYFLLRIQMSKVGYSSVSGVNDRFYREETFRNTSRLMKGLEKKDLLLKQEDQISVSEGLLEALTNIVESSHCLLFKNGMLEKSGGIIAFYYSNDKYCGVLQEKKTVTLVCNSNVEAVYSVFEKKLDADGLGKNFSPENWKKLWNDSEGTKNIDKPVRSAALVHTGNRKGRNAFSIDMLCDKKNIQMLRHFTDSKMDELERGFLPASLWHNIIIAELQRLREEHNYRQGIKEDEQKEENKSDYKKIIESPDFPQNRLSFAGWTIKRFFLGIPGLVKRMIQKKCIMAILMAVWALVLFVYNMYITCYFNDTFMLERRARFGNLSPYLMGGTLRTPNALKGFDLNVGLINTTFLVAPMFAVLLFLARQLFAQIKKRKAKFLWDVLTLAGTARNHKKAGYGCGKEAWIVFAAAFAVGFLLMNPITLFLTAFLSLLIFIQGRENGLIQYLMLYSCAASRKKVERREKREPDFRRISMFFFNFGCGMLFYAVISLVIWFGVDYRFWARLIVTILLIGFCVLQIVTLQSGKSLGKVNKTAVFLVAVFAAAAYFSMRYGIVLADDGGISESGGTLAGLIQNAGFSTILGISLAILGIAVGGPAAWMIAAGAILGGGTFLAGLTDTSAGSYVRKSANQFFSGVPEGESKTLLCTGTELLSLLTSFVNPTASMSTLGVKTIYAGKVTTDVISLVNDVSTVSSDIRQVMDGECGIGTLAWDTLGLAFDVYGTHSDTKEAFDEFARMASMGDAYRYVESPPLRETIENLKTEQTDKIDVSNAAFDSAKDAEIRTEADNFAREYSNYNERIRELESGEVAPIEGMTKEQNIQKYQEYMAEAQTNYNNKVADITAQYQKQAEEAQRAILSEYQKKMAEEYMKEGIDWSSKGYATINEGDSLQEYYDTNWGEKAPATEETIK